MKNWMTIETRLRHDGRTTSPSSDHVAQVMSAIREARAVETSQRTDTPFRSGWSLIAASALAAAVIGALSLQTAPPEDSGLTLGAINPEPLFALEAATHAPLTREATKLRADIAGATAFLSDLLPSTSPDGG